MEPAVQPEASVVQTGLDISYIGKHCYAYSGLHVATQGFVTHLSFTTGSGYIRGIIQLNGAADDDNPSQGEEATCNIYFNDVSVSLIKADPTGSGSAGNAPSSITQDVLIPPFTKVVCIVDTGAAESDRYTSVTLIGRVYGIR